MAADPESASLDPELPELRAEPELLVEPELPVLLTAPELVVDAELLVEAELLVGAELFMEPALFVEPALPLTGKRLPDEEPPAPALLSVAPAELPVVEDEPSLALACGEELGDWFVPKLHAMRKLVAMMRRSARERMGSLPTRLAKCAAAVSMSRADG